MKSIIFILLFLFLSSNTYSQKEYYNWLFGKSAAITFDTPNKNPSNIENYWMTNTSENTSVISTPKGKLRLVSYANIAFSDGPWLKGEHISGHSSSSQGGVLVKLNGDKYLHVSSSFARDDNKSSKNLGFSILNFGIVEYTRYLPNTQKYYTFRSMGIISKYETIRSDYNSEKLLLVKNKCGASVYIITHDYNSNQYRLYWFDIKEEKFVLKHTIDSRFDRHIEDSQLKFNKVNNTFINFSRKNYEIIKLNCNSEELEFVRYESVDIMNDGLSGEYSPNGKYYYFLNSDGIYVLKNMDKVETQKPTIQLLYPEIGIHRQNDFMMGPDSIIYISNQNTRYLLTLENTDDLSTVRLKENAVVLDGTSMIGLPHIPTTMYDYTIDSLLRICEDYSFTLEPNVDWYFENPTYSWTGPNGFKSNERVVNVENAQKKDEGTYHLHVTDDSGKEHIYEYLVYVENLEISKLKAEPEKEIYYDEEVTLSLPIEYDDYWWSTGDTTKEATVSEPGTYTVTYSNDIGCNFTDSISIVFKQDDGFSFIGSRKMCFGTDETISVNDIYTDYLWSTGDTTNQIIIKEQGKYWLEVRTSSGAILRDTFGISYFPIVRAGFKPVPTTFCSGDSVLLESQRINSFYEYKWNTNSESESIYVSETGTYKLTITDTRTGCKDSSEITISVEDNLKVTINGSDICEGQIAILEALPIDPTYSYEWSTGETTPVIEVSQAGTYTVTTSKDGCIGTAEFTVSESPNPEFELMGENIDCGNSATLAPDKDFAEYLWSTDETTKEIEVTEAGTYSLTVTDENGCSSTEEFTVRTESLSFEIIGEDIVCGNTATLSPNKDFSDYLWSTDEVTKEIEVTEAGTYSLTVTDENGCSSTEEYTVNRQSLSFDISKNKIDFGKVYISETRIDSAKITNTSGIDIVITDDGKKYTILSGQTVQYNKTLDPTELGPYTDSFEYRVISPCDTVITIPVTAEVYARGTISSVDIETKIGDEITIPIYLEAEADLPLQTYSITTHLDNSVLLTGSDFTINKNEVIRKSKTKVNEIKGEVLLTSDLQYDITFPSYEFNNPYIEIVTLPSRIKIDTVCGFPYRSIEIVEPTGMKISPNPAKDKLVVNVHSGVSTTLNEPEMKLELISSEGRVAYTENWTQTASEKQLSINTSKIPSGLYQVRLQTPNGVLTENVIVLK